MKGVLAAFLGIWASVSWGQDWNYNLPDTGVLPSFYSAEWMSRVGARHGGSSLGWQRYALSIPFSDPRQSGWKDWYVNVSLDADITMMQTGGSLYLRRGELTSLTLPCALIHEDGQKNRWLVAFAPSIASDFVHVSHSLDVGGLVSYRRRHSESLVYGLGIGIAPRYVDHYILPSFSVEWKMTDQWLLRLDRYRLSVLYQLNDRVTAGCFAQAMGGSWTVDTSRGKMLFRTRSLVVGLTCEYDFACSGQRKRVASLALGSSLASTAEFCRRNAGHEVQWIAHYHPGVYASAQVDFRF